MLPFSLHDNVLTPDPIDQTAIVQDAKKCTVDDIVSNITGEGSILKSTECNAVLPAFFKALGKRLKTAKALSRSLC